MQTPSQHKVRIKITLSGLSSFFHGACMWFHLDALNQALQSLLLLFTPKQTSVLYSMMVVKWIVLLIFYLNCSVTAGKRNN